MSYRQPFEVTGFHSCDKVVGINALQGVYDLKPSKNHWDWLGAGLYFWEQNPERALEYSIESSQRTQFNKVPIKVPFVLGANIELGNCLNLVEAGSIKILQAAYIGLKKLTKEAGTKMPRNNGNIRTLDCAVIQFIHQSNRNNKEPAYDTIRCAFPEGGKVYPGSAITARLHIQICVINLENIKGFFLTRPLSKFNPNLNSGT